MKLIALPPDVAARVAGGDLSVLPTDIMLGGVADLVSAMAAGHTALYAATGAVAPWIGYLAAEPRGAQVVGACGFKGPCRGGVVEIAYFTFPPFEGRGHASAMAGALLDLVAGRPEVREVIAHTLRQDGPSVRVLVAHGFRRLGEIDDPEDGRVWRWTRPCTESADRAAD
ncbi:GNAT family N-acetyltransferase [Roseospira goensis]|uniref:RimJ/RimL family protein N-acetyltransferase n=1 Tax=Roseospira goensis TaxID=391922 RepID=A0A7W6RW57_9PROT|nr:GNAT family protein [Roseospira goensis]MBB4284348.1 RimJ/RimL family protein N-acetyltransferase [Roseospira goensis]